MQTNVLDYLEQIVEIYPNKVAYANEDISLTFQDVYQRAKAIGSGIIDKTGVIPDRYVCTSVSNGCNTSVRTMAVCQTVKCPL